MGTAGAWAFSQLCVDPLPCTGIRGHSGIWAQAVWGLHAEALSTKEHVYLSASRYEISGEDLGWVWLGPEMGEGSSLKEERELIAK